MEPAPQIQQQQCYWGSCVQASLSKRGRDARRGAAASLGITWCSEMSAEAPKGCAGSFGVGKMSSFPALWPSLGASLRAKSPGRQGLGSGLGAEFCQLPLPASSQAFAAASGDKMIFFYFFFILLIQLLEKNALSGCHG